MRAILTLILALILVTVMVEPMFGHDHADRLDAIRNDPARTGSLSG